MTRCIVRMNCKDIAKQKEYIEEWERLETLSTTQFFDELKDNFFLSTKFLVDTYGPCVLYDEFLHYVGLVECGLQIYFSFITEKDLHDEVEPYLTDWKQELRDRLENSN